MLNKIKKLARRSKIIREIYKNINASLIETSIGEITPLNARKSLFEGKRINLIVPSINQEHLFGGISTALHFFDELSGDKFKRRIILTDASPTQKDLEPFKEYKFLSMDEDANDEYQIVAVNDRYNRTLPVSSNDIFMATAWWTAYAAQRLVKWQSEAYNQNIKEMIYFIQDFEPGFYQWSSQYVLAESTYKYDGPQIAIFNSSLLNDYFKEKGYMFSQEYCFEPKLNHKLREYFLMEEQVAKKRQILIYGRPSVARNGFSLIIESLRIWSQTYPRASEWNIISAGEQHPNIDIGNGITVISKGKMSLEEYAKILLESAVGISLMISPHPSYPPLEMACFGLKVITNSFENKNLSEASRNILSIKKCSPDEIAQNIYYLCNNINLKCNLNKNIVEFYVNDIPQFDFINRLQKKL
ncbi:hypothetical protein [Aneurinibacillus terranovensis]|uniref:rhamnosyltransferase WsaF family glycosyltransferase n=1 Tax=Aneurinibacillus terranovensis TaxID=278991 RepID=UPI00040A1622|nr:hypothetical protein [Aneurinibacillus terranovensis]